MKLDITNQHWDSDGFADVINAAMISCYESKIAVDKTIPRQDRLTPAIINRLRELGPYIPINPDRHDIFVKYIDNISSDCKKIIFDNVEVDEGLISVPMIGNDNYIKSIYFKREKKFTKGWKNIYPFSKLFSIYSISVNQKGEISGSKTFFTIDEQQRILPCEDPVVVNVIRHYLEDKPGLPSEITKDLISQYYDSIEQYNHKTSICTGAIWFSQLPQVTWTISSDDGNVRASIGCMEEEIKSLLYARDLPLTSTGRKRPIIHLVNAHKRRMKEGLDIDINKFLRGVHEVVIDNTKFAVKPPIMLKSTLQTSGKYFE